MIFVELENIKSTYVLATSKTTSLCVRVLISNIFAPTLVIFIQWSVTVAHNNKSSPLLINFIQLYLY